MAALASPADEETTAHQDPTADGLHSPRPPPPPPRGHQLPVSSPCRMSESAQAGFSGWPAEAGRPGDRIRRWMTLLHGLTVKVTMHHLRGKIPT
jgi:hypothetical protein